MSLSVKKGKNNNSKSPNSNKLTIKIEHLRTDKEIKTSINDLTEEEKIELEKQKELLKQIKEYEAKLKFEKEQGKILIEMKESEIEQKEKRIKEMTDANTHLEGELAKLQARFQEQLDHMENKEKNDKNELEKNKEKESLAQLLKVKEKELDNNNLVIDKYKKEKDALKKKLDEDFNINEINNLNDQIKIAQKKVDELKEEKNYYYKIKEEHLKCQDEQNKIIKEINNLKEELNKIKEENKNKSKQERLNMGVGTNFQSRNKGLSEEQIQIKKEQKIKKSLDEFWKKNQDKLLNSSNDNAAFKNNTINNEYSNIDNDNYPGTIIRRSQRKSINTLFKRKKQFGDEVRNKNLDIDNSIELPIIPLFNKNEKKILLNILPEKEIEKYEKRYECVDKVKNAIQRKLALENKQLAKENEELGIQYENSNNQLEEHEVKNIFLNREIENQKKELVKLQKKLENIEKRVEDKKKQVAEKDEENKELIKQLKELKDKYGKIPNNNGNEYENEYENDNNNDDDE